MKVAIYCRFSDEDRDKRSKLDDSESIQNQKNMLTKYAIEQRWSIYNIYSDDDYSGLDSERPEFCKMIAEAEQGKFNIILCKSQSRFTRDMELIEKYLHNKFLEWNIRFISLSDHVDTHQKGGKKARQINGLVNEWYCEDISETIKATFKSKIEDGKFIGSFATYGYAKDPSDKNKLIVDEVAAETVRQIYKWYLEGNGTQHIAFMLNDKGIPNPTKYKQMKGLNYVNAAQKKSYGLWNKTTIKRILKNQMYIGNMVQGVVKKVSYKTKKKINVDKEDWVVVEGTHEAIIDKTTFESVQKRITSRGGSSGTGKTHIFASKVKCMDCGSTMSKTSNTSARSKNVYLRCSLYAKTGKQNKLCSSHSIRLDELEAIVTEKIVTHFTMIDNDFVSSKLHQQSEISNRVLAIKKEQTMNTKLIEEKTTLIKNLYIDKVKGVVDEVLFIEMKSSFEKEKETLLGRQEELSKHIEEIQNKINDIEAYRAIVNRYKNIDKLTPTIVNKFIDYIEIGEKDKETKERVIKIKWLFWF
ncbi:recombinase family protein [Alkaliphilus transvaalensis]|uniref:recombinase family protein n=1 Tax=Alkaliphilus transvaalensis TaxID=114628 RepID=UPI000479FC95|nr:recombinase family protein [Alkaliphilus transvaalensis]